MKTTKRILALITALVLCLVPMMFMIEAAEIAIRGVNVEVCDCNNPGKPWGVHMQDIRMNIIRTGANAMTILAVILLV